MKQAKLVQIKKSPKEERERKVLIGLVAHYIKHGKPVGSETLKESEFQDVSSATLRNYFVRLEEGGYLKQHHASGGRIPTDKAFRLYADSVLGEFQKGARSKAKLPSFTDSEITEMKEVILYLQQITESVSELSHTASFLSAPRFDQDFVIDIKLIGFEQGRYLSALLTNFGLIHTEILHSPKKLSSHSLKRLESYFRARLTSGQIVADELDHEELEIAHRFYQEAMARYLVSYSNFTEEDLFRAGFSKLLRYPEFQDAVALTSSLSLFENRTALRLLIRECMKGEGIKYWIGEDLFTHLTSSLNCAVIACPYRIGQKIVGAIGIIGPMRLPYEELFTMLSDAAQAISKCLTASLYKYRISFRTPDAQLLEFIGEKRFLLEDKGSL